MSKHLVTVEPEVVDAMHWAFELGDRHVATAQAEGNEGGVRQGLRESGVPREPAFIIAKLSRSGRSRNGSASTTSTCKTSTGRLAASLSGFYPGE